jgi:hypothetical protein
MTFIFVFAGGLAPITERAFVIVLKAQTEAAVPPAMPLPLPSVSEPLIGSTVYVLLAIASHCVHVFPWQAGVPAEHCALEQQFPATHTSFPLTLQHSSPALTGHVVFGVAHAFDTHVPELVLQTNAEPYAGSFLHCASVVHDAHELEAHTLPLHVALEWQFPATHEPPLQMNVPLSA